MQHVSDHLFGAHSVHCGHSLHRTHETDIRFFGCSVFTEVVSSPYYKYIASICLKDISYLTEDVKAIVGDIFSGLSR